jgi:enoyl-CoA hydratase/carnithine racemase
MIADTEFLSLRHAPPVYSLCLKNGGACSLAFIDSLNVCLDMVETSQGPACLIISGQDKAFSTGFHLEDFFSGDTAMRNEMLSRATKLLGRVAALPVPTAAAMNGHAFGFGAMLAMACDRRVMRSDRGFFCLPELDLQVAIPRPMMELLKLKLRHDVLTDLLFSCRRIGGQEACGLGIVDAACPLAELMDRAQAMVLPLAGKDRSTIGSMKRELYRQFLDTVPRA